MSDVTGTYYAGEAFIGYGAELLVGQGPAASPEVFIAVADVSVITPGEWSTGTLENTHLRSPARHREHLATLRNSGPFQVQGNYRPGHGEHKTAGGDGFSATKNLVYLWVNVVENNFKINLPVSPLITLAFTGVITKYQVGALSVEQKCDFTLEITPLRAFTLP